MPATSDARKRGGLHRRRIIERPRLLALLNGSPARVRTLIAPAGYGKTTLAEQWVGQKGRRHAWFTARSSSTDVAALALGLARAATAIVPDCDARLREHLRALPAPAEHVDVLAELLGEDLADWPGEAWLVLDDYHELTSTQEAERFVEELVAAAPIQLLIASRQRPSWVKARKILYGEVLELNQTELAMDGHEAAEVLTDRNATSASELVALAAGWPAVIGLASVSNAEVQEPSDVPSALYEFFAEEVFSSLSTDIQAGLKTLAIAPNLHRNLALSLLGESCDEICTVAMDVGIIVERGRQLEIHPLARAFLEAQLEHLGPPDNEAVERCIEDARARKDWDAALDLILRRGHASHLEQLLEDALDELLETARLSNIESWCEHASASGWDSPAVRLARAEVALRYGRLAEAQAYAEAAASQPSRSKVRALLTAGRAAHLASRDVEALELFRRAESEAIDDVARREARWGQAFCAVDLEMPIATELLDELVEGVDQHDPREAVRAAGHHFVANALAGRVDLTGADRAAALLPVLEDPLVESGFLSVYASGLAAAARYDDARTASASLLDIATRYRLNFAIPYACYSSGIAEAGLRRWVEAERTLHHGMLEARKTSNAHAEQGCVAALIRTLVQRRRVAAALALAGRYSSQRFAPVPVSSHVEFMTSHALALAAADQLNEASNLIDTVEGVSPAAEGVALCAGVGAIIAFKRRDVDAIDRVVEFGQQAMSLGALDILVTSYRAVPEILTILLRSSTSSEIHELVSRIGDTDLAEAVGYPIAAERDATALLTPRESEVYELLRQGLSNRDIARLLFITEGTAKRHVQHVFDKLGVRSRRTIAMQAALERVAQATSAIDETGVGTDS